MPGKLLFVHGTGVRDVSPAMEKIRAGMKDALGWEADQILPIEWGIAVGPQSLDVSVALPPEQAARAVDFGMAAMPSPADAETALWDLLLLDPTVELRALGEQSLERKIVIDPGVLAPGVALEERVRQLTLSDEQLAVYGFTGKDLQAAIKRISGEPGLSAAAARKVEDATLRETTARAITAAMIIAATAQIPSDASIPDAASDPDARTRFAQALADALAPADAQGLAGRGLFVDKIVAPLATRLAVSKRAAMMKPFYEFARDVTFYLEHGKTIRDMIAKVIREHDSDGPTIALGHSLGGIAVVDLLADTGEMRGDSRLKVDLLVTVGSQSPMLYLMDSLSSLSPRKPDVLPFVPWLNIYNPDDLLSFCAQRVFPARPQIVDEPVDAGVPFPMSHSAYWGKPRTYELIGQHLQP